MSFKADFKPPSLVYQKLRRLIRGLLCAMSDLGQSQNGSIILSSTVMNDAMWAFSEAHIYTEVDSSRIGKGLPRI